MRVAATARANQTILCAARSGGGGAVHHLKYGEGRSPRRAMYRMLLLYIFAPFIAYVLSLCICVRAAFCIRCVRRRRRNNNRTHIAYILEIDLLFRIMHFPEKQRRVYFKLCIQNAT